jgi:hypothetical protein
LRIAKVVARAVAALLIFCFCLLILFVLGVFATFKTNLLIYGNQELDGNAGAGFAVLLEGICVGSVLALIGLPFVVHLINRIPRLRDSDDAPPGISRTRRATPALY